MLTDDITSRIDALPNGMTKSKAVALLKASVAAWTRYNGGESAALKDAQAADVALAELMDRAEAAQGGGDEAEAADRPFKNRKDAYEWLVAQGAGTKVSRGKFYEDCAAGKVIVFRNKTVSRASVALYLIKLQQDAPVFDPEAGDLSAIKQRLEIKWLEQKIAKGERDGRADDRRWMLREDSWALLAGVLGMLRQTFDYHINQRAGELALAVEGRAELAPQLVDMLLLNVVNPAFNDLAGKTLEHACFAEMPRANVEDDDGGEA